MPLQNELRAWFEALQECVDRADYETARRELFVPDAIGFGTKASLAVGVDALQQNQWSGIWPNIRDFRFDLDGMRCGGEGDTAWAVATWSSTGFGEGGAPFERPGRATVIFTRQDGHWKARHTHFSLFPGTPGSTRRS